MSLRKRHKLVPSMTQIWNAVQPTGYHPTNASIYREKLTDIFRAAIRSFHYDRWFYEVVATKHLGYANGENANDNNQDIGTMKCHSFRLQW